MREYTYNELKESKFIMQRPLPKFGVIMTVMTLFFVIGIIFLAGFNTKTYVVKASGMAVNANKSYIMNSVAGSVKVVNAVEGQMVNTGDVLFEIDALQIDVQIAQIQGAIDYLNLKIENQNKLIDFMSLYTLLDIGNKANPFDKNIADEKQCFDDAQYFIESVKTAISEDNIYSARVQLSSQPYQIISNYTYEKINNEAKKQAFLDALAEYKVKAATAGKVHFNSAISAGTVIQAGSMIGSISGDDKEEIYFETVISAIDRSKLSIDCDVEIALGGVMQSEFGVLKGKVTHIDNDSIQNEKGEIFYKLKVKPLITYLTNKKKQTVELTNGMVAECRVKYDETTWLKWAIEQIGVKFR